VQGEKDALELVDISTPENRAERAAEKEKEATRLDEKKELAIRDIRDEFMGKIRAARSEGEKERLLTEMQERIRQAEQDAERERRRQLQLLDKQLKARQRRRLKKKVDAKQAEL
jgi:hypothetical protein